MASEERRFDWPVAYEAEAYLGEQIDVFLNRMPLARWLAESMEKETGTLFFEWVDHLVLGRSREEELRRVGLTREEAQTLDGVECYGHPRAMLPRVLVRGNDTVEVALRPEFLPDFLAANSWNPPITGAPFSRLRRAVIAEVQGARLVGLERRAYRGFLPCAEDAQALAATLRARELWRLRRRRLDDAEEGFAEANRVLDEVLALVSRDVACDLFFEEERRYWQSRNQAARLQKHRQDQLGLGWGNHDHHTFRCSRRHFVDLISFLMRLGFEKRERYYAGAEAGWGAQISEQPVAGIVVFADVDLEPEETEIDFSVRRLPESRRLGTVGLWTALHGESFLGAGMHHLEARFDFEALREQLGREGVNTMKPFSYFPFLKQAFTEGEGWAVAAERANRLLERGLISADQRDRFVRDGAIGSHLENLQRRGGYKGFNQKSVSAIIEATDPRAVAASHAGASP